jgi:hypothetical protein
MAWASVAQPILTDPTEMGCATQTYSIGTSLLNKVRVSKAA